MPTLIDHVRAHAAAYCAAAGVRAPAFTDAQVAAALAAEGPGAARRRAERFAEGGRLLALPDVPQGGNFDCGAAATMSVARYFGVGPDTLEGWKALLGTDPENGTSPAQIIAGLDGLGLSVTARQGMTLADLRACFDRGEPVLAAIQDYGSRAEATADESGHWVAVCGLGYGFVFAQDPAADNVLAGAGSDAAPGLVLIAGDDWLAAWHDRDGAGTPFVRYGIAVGPPAGAAAFAEHDVSGEARDAEGKWTGGGGGAAKKGKGRHPVLEEEFPGLSPRKAWVELRYGHEDGHVEKPRKLVLPAGGGESDRPVEALPLDLAGEYSLVRDPDARSYAVLPTAKLNAAAQKHAARRQAEAEREAAADAAWQEKAGRVRAKIDPTLAAGIKQAVSQAPVSHESLVFELTHGGAKLTPRAAEKLLRRLSFVGELQKTYSAGKTKYALPPPPKGEGPRKAD